MLFQQLKFVLLCWIRNLHQVVMKIIFSRRAKIKINDKNTDESLIDQLK